MNTTLKEYGPSVQLWSMFGPLLVACIALAVVIRSASGEWMLPLVALSGTFICYRWGWLGFAAVSVALFASAAYQLYTSEPAEWLWIIVLTLSIVSTLIAALLMLGNSKGGWEIFDARYAALQGDVSKLQEQLQASQGILEAEREASTEQRVMLHDQLSKGEEKIASYERLLALVREEISSGRERQEKLLQDLSEARQRVGVLEQRIAAMQAKAVQELRLCNEKAQAVIKETLSLRESELASLKIQLESAQEEELLFRRQAENYVLELVSLREENQKNIDLTAEIQDVLHGKNVVIKDLNERIEALSCEKQHIETSLSNLQDQCEGLREQEREKSIVADRYAAAIRVLEAAIESKEDELRNEKSSLAESKVLCSTQEQQFLKEIADLQNEKAALSQAKHLSTDQEQLFLKEIEDLKQSGSRELRRVEGLYNQLRAQFAEKSNVLDQTRRELFYAQERAAALQKEAEEFQKFGNDFVEERLYKMLTSLERETASLERSAQREIRALEDIVSTLASS